MAERNFYEEGRQAWRDGADRPDMPADDAPEAECLFWVGFVFECARDYFKRRGMALYPETVVPRP